MKIAVTVLAFSTLLHGQPRPVISFDVASVRVDNSDFVLGVSYRKKGGPGTSDPARVTYAQFDLRYLIEEAWGLESFQIMGPSWLNDVHPQYTITASLPAETTKEQFQLMLRNLLLERFQMSVHEEVRHLQGVELIIAPGGLKLKETTQDPASPPSTPMGIDNNGFPVLGLGRAAGTTMLNGITRVKCQNYTIAELISPYVRAGLHESGVNVAAIVDKTNLGGHYDIKLEYSPQQNVPVLTGASVESSAPASNDSGGAPGFFSALEKQTGLKLVRKTLPTTVLVIDAVEKNPTGN